MKERKEKKEKKGRRGGEGIEIHDDGKDVVNVGGREDELSSVELS